MFAGEGGVGVWGTYVGSGLIGGAKSAEMGVGTGRVFLVGSSSIYRTEEPLLFGSHFGEKEGYPQP